MYKRPLALDLDWPAHRARDDRVLVVVEPHQAGLGDRSLRCVEPVERTTDLHQLGTLRLEHLPDREVGQLAMLVRLGVGDTSVEQPGVQLIVARHSKPRREEALAHQSNLVLDLALLPHGRSWPHNDPESRECRRLSADAGQSVAQLSPHP